MDSDAFLRGQNSNGRLQSRDKPTVLVALGELEVESTFDYYYCSIMLRTGALRCKLCGEREEKKERGSMPPAGN